MNRLLPLCLCLALGLSCVNTAKVQKPRISLLPVLKVVSDSSGKTLQVSRLRVDVQVTGNIATTTFDITFYTNDAATVLEGEFDFPLADGQSISRYALEVDSSLREGVVVEKAKARVAFENTIRRKVDPGLVEKTAGNHFRTRVYPIPARGYKRIVIGIEQALAASADGLHYDLPLNMPYKLDAFALQATVAQPAQAPVVTQAAAPGLAFRSGDGAWKVSFAKAGFQPSDGLAFTIPLEGEPLVYSETVAGNDYFYAWLPADSAARARPLPKTITVYWDVSGSAAERNSAQETALLQAYLSALNDVTVTVVPFAIRTYAPSVFGVKGGDATAVVDFLKKTTEFDGGTQLGALDFRAFPADELWLLSDGISTFGKKEIALSAAPVTVVTSAPGADFSYLKYIARQTGGRFVDLAAHDVPAAAAQLLREEEQFLSAEANAGSIEALVTPVQTGMHNGFSVAGILKAPEATLTLCFGYGKTVTRRQTVTVRKGVGGAAGVGRIWASLQIGELDLQYAKNKEAITALGKQFSIVTRNTSLLVLDRVEDYVEHEIEPPAPLLAEYRALLKEKKSTAQDASTQAREEARSAMQELVAWWQSPVQKKPATDTTLFTPPVPVGDVAIAGVGTDSTAVARAPVPPAYYQSSTPAAAEMTTTTTAAEGLMEMRAQEPPAAAADDKAAVVAIEVQEWKPDAPYLAALQATPASARYKKYLALKGQYARQPSFFIDVARFFQAQGDSSTALQVLSNVTELKLESPELLRNVAEQLLEFGHTALAVETFRDVLDIREEEPQAYRDLALACNEAGNYQEAVQLLYKVATGVWDGRFGGVREVALCEMNAIISAHRGQVDIAGIDPEFVKALPVDVRIVIGWSADNSDIDLWVTDPRKEKCYYQNTSTAIGGRISEDATQGYGPEEFLLKKAAGGDYAIEVNLYGDRRESLGGPITIKAELFTDFGRPTQQRKVISFRLTDHKEVVKIGKLVFGKGG